MPAGANDYTKQYVREIETSVSGLHESVIHFRLKANRSSEKKEKPKPLKVEFHSLNQH